VLIGGGTYVELELELGFEVVLEVLLVEAGVEVEDGPAEDEELGGSGLPDVIPKKARSIAS